MTNSKEINYLKPYCIRAMQYHLARWQFFSRFSGLRLYGSLAIFIITLPYFMSLYIEGFTVHMTSDTVMFVLLTLLVMSILNPLDQSILHQVLYFRFKTIIEFMETVNNPNTPFLEHWQTIIIKAWDNQPPIYWALLTHIDNLNCIALGYEKKNCIAIKWYHRLFRNWFCFQKMKSSLLPFAPGEPFKKPKRATQ